MKFSFLVFFLLSYPVICRTQGISPVFNEYDFENGLSSNEILCIAQDEDNFLWIGTNSGLNRFDGNSFTQYFKSNDTNSIAGNRINAICVLPNHKLAIATAGGLNFLDTHTRVFTTFRIKDSTALSFFRNSFIILCLDKNGNLWAATQTDLLIFNSQLKLIHTAHGNYKPSDINRKIIQWIGNIYALSDGQVCVSENNQLLFYNPSTFKATKFSEQSQSKWSFLTKSTALDLLFHSRQKKISYTLADNDSIFSRDLSNSSVNAFLLFKNASAHFSWASRLFFFDEQTAYLQLADTGFFKLSFEGSSLRVTHIDNIPVMSSAAVFFRDHQNNLWVGSSSGLYELTTFKNQFGSINFSGDDREKIQAENTCFFKSGDHLWIGSYGNGLYDYNVKKKTFRQYAFQMPHTTVLNQIWNIAAHNGDTLWLGTQEGLLWFVPGEKKYGRIICHHPSILDSFPVTTQFTDSRGYLWIGVGLGHGLIRYDPGTNSFRLYDSYSSPAFPLRHPTAIAEDENSNLWMGTQRGGGLVEWTRASNQFNLFPANALGAFSDDQVNAIFADNHGYVWIGTSSAGLLKYDLRKNSFEDFGKEKGLSNEKVMNVDGTQYPFLWLTTALGFDRFNTITNTFESFYKRDGLPSDIINGGIYFDSSNSTMYAGCTNGFVEFNPGRIFINKYLPQVFIDGIVVNDKPLHEDDKHFLLGYKQNNLTVRFTAVDLVNGSDLTFRYRLNDETNWINAGRNREIHFSNLSPADYSLSIEVANKTGAWNEKATTLAFSIVPPFWHTWWFYIIAAAIVTTIIFSFYRFRIRQLQRVQEMRNRIAQDLHDDIGGTMTAINLTNQLALQRLNEPPVAKKLLTDISEDLKNMGETLDDIVWTVNPKNDSMQEVMARMRRYASRTWEAAGINFDFSFDEQADQIRLNMEQRHDLYLVFKEAVNNVAKHAKCTRASSTLSLYNHSLMIQVTDNGKGFDVHSATNRNGLKNIESRIKKWKGSVEIDSTAGQGTKVQLRMPITQKGD